MTGNAFMRAIGMEGGVVLSTTTTGIATETETITIMTDMVIVAMIAGGTRISRYKAILAPTLPVSTNRELWVARSSRAT